MANNKVVTVYKNPLTILLNICAVLVSWFFNHSIFWAIVHYLFGPLYLLYCLVLGRFSDGTLGKIIEYFFG